MLSCSLKELFEILKGMFKLYDSLNLSKDFFDESVFMHRSDKNLELFTKTTIAKYILAFCIKNKNYEVNKMVSLIQNLDSRDLIIFGKALRELTSTKDEESKKEVSFTATDTGKIKGEIDNNESIKRSIDARNKINLENQKKKTIDLFLKTFNKYIKKNIFYNGTTPTNLIKRKFSLLIRKNELGKIPKTYDKYCYYIVKRLIETILRNNIAHGVFKVKPNDRKDLNDYVLGNYILYYEEKAIKFNANISEEKINIVPADEDYIRKIIIPTYSKKGELYRYIEKDYCYFLSEDELFEKIKNELFNINFEIEFNLVIDNDKCFYGYNTKCKE